MRRLKRIERLPETPAAGGAEGPRRAPRIAGAVNRAMSKQAARKTPHPEDPELAAGKSREGRGLIDFLSQLERCR